MSAQVVAEPLQITVRLDYYSAITRQLQQAMEPSIKWKGDPRQAQEDAHAATMLHIAKAVSMLTDMTTVGADQAYEFHLPAIKAK